LFKRVLDQGPEQRESNLTVLCLLIIIILISYIIIYYIIIKLLIMENHSSRNWKPNSGWFVEHLSPTYSEKQSVIKTISLTFVILVTPKAEAKQELLFNKSCTEALNKESQIRLYSVRQLL
jgi:hypothetical protein